MTPGMIYTLSGKVVDVCHPTPWMIDRRDVARGLTYGSRWSGQTTRRLSVAEHSLWVARAVKRIVPREQADLAQLVGLTHDAHEAYLVDLPTPVKVLTSGYVEVAELLQLSIDEHFGIREVPSVVAKAVKRADGWAAWAEANALVPGAVSECIHVPPDDVAIDLQVQRVAPTDAQVEESWLRFLDYLLRINNR